MIWVFVAALAIGFCLAAYALRREWGRGDTYQEIMVAGGAVWLWLPCLIFEWWRWRRQRAWEKQRWAEWEERRRAA